LFLSSFFDFGHAPYTFLPQVVCGVFTLLARSLRFTEILAVLLSGSMNSGGGYSVVKVQLTKLILFFCIQFSILRFQLNIPLDIRQ